LIFDGWGLLEGARVGFGVKVHMLTAISVWIGDRSALLPQLRRQLPREARSISSMLGSIKDAASLLEASASAFKREARSFRAMPVAMSCFAP
jgi:hypothetical protein